MSWDERFSDLRTELRAARREADLLTEGNVEPTALQRRKAAVRKSLYEMEIIIKDLAAKAKETPDAEERRERLGKLDQAKEQRNGISGLLISKKEGGVFQSIRKIFEKKEEEPEDMFDDEDDQTLLMLQNQQLERQDETLNRLHNVILQQKAVGHAINIELDEQSGIVDQMGTGVERSTTAIRNETKRINKLLDASQADSRMTYCICFLLLMLVLVVILAFET
eukprot:TRINITY_DN1985_c2_g1_i1.p1 TRINITY_DN1985_c2_g1~~TRINITY_DN1985_c2_g1_i1.p1  ORF type:complete len:223 (+),score=66.32 TRINITY_DN1985_c2_g1_i1:98-766(+)